MANIKRLFSFKGRIRRKEYWMTYLVINAVGFAVGIAVGVFAVICACLAAYFGSSEDQGNDLIFILTLGAFIVLIVLLVVCVVFLVGSIWIGIAQNTKRCHDRGNSGWYQLIPYYYAWMLIADGNPYANKYGLDPKGRDEPERGLKLWEKIGIGILILLHIIYVITYVYFLCEWQ